MPSRCDRAAALFFTLALACLIPLRLIIAAGAPVPWPQPGCESPASALQQMRANVGMETGIADRANRLADAAHSGQPPSDADIDQLGDDSLESLDDAGGEIEEAGEVIGQRLQGLNLTRQSRAWSQGMNRLRNSRQRFNDVWRPKRGQAPVKFSRISGATGPIYGPTHVYIESIEHLKKIAIDGGFYPEGPFNILINIPPDGRTTPNPGWDPMEEFRRRLQAAIARAQAAGKGLNAARALQTKQFEQARQEAQHMRDALQEAARASNGLQEAVSQCAQAQNNAALRDTPPPPNPAPEPAPASSAPAKAKGGGGFGTGMAVLLGLGVAGGAAYYAYQQYYACPAYANTANYNACVSGSGSCSTCTAALNEMQPYCQCYENKGLQTPGLCRSVQEAVDYAYATGVCRVPAAPALAR